jgi:serine/threonine-protein kinase
MFAGPLNLKDFFGKDAPDSAYASEMIRRYDDGALRSYLQGDGALSLESDPPADVTLLRFVEQGRVLVPADEKPIGATPIARMALPMGSYLCILRRPGFRDVRYPVHVTRQRAWEGRVRLRTDAEIGEEFVYVPGGPFAYGEGKSARTLDLPDFAIAKYPVTFSEYGDYLAALEAQGGERAALERIRRNYDGDPRVERGADGRWHPKAVVVEGPARERCLREHGVGFEERIPVYGITWDDAAAYCAWKSERTGREWRLPTEEEREKAARGVDGRRFPWGDCDDPTLSKNREARDEPTQIEPIGTFPTAVSVYGMGDAAGNVWDWTASWFDARHLSRVLRGGSWVAVPLYLRCAYRDHSRPHIRYTSYGFRCARSL